MMRSFWGIILTFVAATTASALSQAQPTVPPAPTETPEGQLSAADELFRRGNEKMAKGKYHDACPDYEASDRLDHKLATRFRLADCYERIGRVASAWEKFTQVADEAKLTGKAEPEQLARERADRLSRKRPWLTIVVPASVAEVSGLVIKRDDVAVGQPLWNKPVAVDPGEHTVVAAAPDKYDWRQRITIKEAETKQVRIDELDALPMSRRRVAALAVGGIGVAGLIVGSILGASAISIAQNEVDACPETKKPCTGDKPKAMALAHGSTVALSIGGVGLGAAAILFFTAPVSDDAKPRTSWQFAPVVTPNGAGVLVGGRF